METVNYVVDFTQYKPGDRFQEFCTPGSQIPGTIANDGGGLAIQWTGTWMSYIRIAKDIAGGGLFRLKQRVRLYHPTGLAKMSALTYNTRTWGTARMYVDQSGMLCVAAFPDQYSADSYRNCLGSKQVCAFDGQAHEWEVTITKSNVNIVFDGQPAVNADIPAALQGSQIDSVRVVCPLTFVSAHEVAVVTD